MATNHNVSVRTGICGPSSAPYGYATIRVTDTGTGRTAEHYSDGLGRTSVRLFDAGGTQVRELDYFDGTEQCANRLNAMRAHYLFKTHVGMTPEQAYEETQGLTRDMGRRGAPC